MKIIRWSTIGLMMAPLIFGGSLAQAFTLPANFVPGTQKNITPKHVNPKVVQKQSLPKKGSQSIIQGCPKLVAQELHIVRAEPQPGHPDHYSFILDGTIVNQGLTGLATAGFNVTRKLNGRVVHRVALHLFKQQARHNQRFDLNRDFHVPIQSKAISREDASHSTFELSVTNLSNDKGQCSVYNPTVATVSSAKVRQAFPAQLHRGVSQKVGSLKKNGARPALAAPKPLFGHGKPVTRRDGKSLIPPKTGPRHVLGGDAPAIPHGGFAAVPAARPLVGLGAPVTGRDGTSLIPRNKLKLTLVGIKVNNQDVIRHSVSIGDMATALVDVHNLSNTTERIRVAYMINGRPFFATGLSTIAPGQTTPMLVNVRINGTNSDRNIHRVSGEEELWWTPVFALVTEGNNPYRDSNMADNTNDQLNPIYILVKPKNDLAVAGIQDVTLTETWHGGGSLDEGTIHPVSLAAIIRVKNNGSQNSRPMTMSVNLMSTREATTSVRGSRGASYDRVGSCASWPMCSMSQDISIAAVAAGQTVSFPVHFAPIPHSIERARHGGKMAGGPYACGRGGDVMPSAAKITVGLRTADEDAAFMQNNTLTKEGRFGTSPFGPDTVTCGFH